MQPEDEHEKGVCEHFQLAASLVGRRWIPQIVSALLSGETRFRDLRAGIPAISDNLLSDRLKELEAQGILTREVESSTPVLIEYRLTERGRDLAGVIDELSHWAERWAEAPAPR
jgi:DNA-binding HxlR family transcriptional regulator